MIGNKCNQSSLMRIVERQKSQTQHNVEEPKSEVQTKGGQLYKIRRNFENRVYENTKRSNLGNLEDFPCPSGNVASLKAKLSPVLFRSPSNLSDGSYISIDSIVSKSSSFIRTKHTRSSAKFYTFERESESVHSENSIEYESIGDDCPKRLSGSMNDLNLNECENYVKLPFVLPVGETSDNVYEDVDLLLSNNEKRQAAEAGLGDDNDDFGFELCEAPSDEKLVEVYNGIVQNVQESQWSMYKRKLKEQIKELIQSEMNYIERLKLVIDNYIPELNHHQSVPSEDFTKENIFYNIEKILYFHKHVILPSFLRYKRNLRQLAYVFVNNEQLFTLYVEYSTNYKLANKIVNDHLEFFTPVQRELNDKMNLSSYLLEPVQRLPKYMLFLGDLNKSYQKYAEGKKEHLLNSGGIENDDENEEDKILKAFHEAFATVKRMLSSIDDSITISNIKNPLVNLKEQGRLLMHDEFNVTDKNGRRRFMRCFLFENTFIFTVIDKSLPKEETYVYHDSIPMEQLGLTPPENDYVYRFCVWYLKRNYKNYSLEANTSVCNSWVKKISSLLWEEALSKKEELLKRDGSKWTNSLRTVKPRKSQLPNDFEEVGIESSTKTLNPGPEKYSSLRGVRGEMNSEKKPTKKRTTWYVDENS